MRILEVEYLTGWGTAADRDEAQQAKEQTVFHMARAFGVRHLNAGLLEKLPLDVVAEEFAALCERAGTGSDGRAGVHALQRRPRPRDGLADRAGSAERRLIVDDWHWARAGQQAADLDEVPAERIVSVQLCDVRAEPMEPLRAESLGPPAAARAGLRRHDRHGAGPGRPWRRPRRHDGRGDLRRTGGPRRGRRRAGDGGRGPRGPRIRRWLTQRKRIPPNLTIGSPSRERDAWASVSTARRSAALSVANPKCTSAGVRSPMPV